MRSVAGTPLRFIGLVVAINAAIIAVVESAAAIIISSHVQKVAAHFDNILATSRFSSTVAHVDRAGVLGLVIVIAVIVGIALSLHRPRIASLVFLGSAVVGVILTPFVFAFPAFMLLNAAAIVFFGRKETRTTVASGAENAPTGSDPTD